MSMPDVEKSTTQSDLSVARVGRQRSPQNTSATLPRPPRRPATYRDVFAVGEFRAVFLADLLSLLGDQIAAVAVAVLVYERSGSPLLSALGYATAYVPWLLGGPFLAAWAERFPARRVLVAPI